ncbi:MAG: DUF6950 family protein [Alteromonas sp.]
MQLRIHQALNKWRKRNFDYGDADCCQFAGFIVQELTGKNYLATFNYQSQPEADNIISGFGGLEHTVSSVLGDSQRSFHMLDDGSPVLCEMPYGQLLGVKLGSVAIALGKKGFINIPQSMFKAGWNLWKL